MKIPAIKSAPKTENIYDSENTVASTLTTPQETVASERALPADPAARSFLMRLGLGAISTVYQVGRSMGSAGYHATWSLGSAGITTVIPGVYKTMVWAAPKVIKLLPGGSLVLGSMHLIKNIFIASTSGALFYGFWIKGIPWAVNNVGGLADRATTIIGSGLKLAGVNTNDLAENAASFLLQADKTTPEGQWLVRHAKKHGVVTAVLDKALIDTATVTANTATYIFSRAKDITLELLQPVTDAPFQFLGWTLGQTINFGFFVAPKILFQFASTVKMENWAYIIGGLSLAYYFSEKPRPSLAIEYKRVTRISTAKDFVVNKIDEFVKTHQASAQRLYQYYDWMFPTRAKPIFNASIAKEIDGIERSIKNAINNDGCLENLLLEGPPGTGKTMVAAKIAADSGCNFVRMSGVDLSNLIRHGSYEHLTKFKEILAFGSDTHRPTVLFIDEMDAIGRADIDHAHRVLREAFLAATGDPSKVRMIIGTTNNVRDMHSAVLSRFGNIIHVGAPDKTNRFHILNEHLNEQLKDIPERAHTLNAAGIQRIAGQTAGLVGRDLQQLVVKLKRTKAQTEHNWMDEATIDQAVHSFIEQKRAVNRSFFSSLSKVSNMVFDFWHFTLSSMKRGLSTRLFGEPARPILPPIPLWKRPLRILARV